MPPELEQMQWARVLQALWLLAETTARVRGGVLASALIPGVRDSARRVLSRQGVRKLFAAYLTLGHESPRQAELIIARLDQADARVRWFIEAEPTTLPLAGHEALLAGADWLEALRTITMDATTKRDVEAIVGTFRVIGSLEALSDQEVEVISTLRRQVDQEPANRELRAKLFDLESR